MIIWDRQWITTHSNSICVEKDWNENHWAKKEMCQSAVVVIGNGVVLLEACVSSTPTAVNLAMETIVAYGWCGKGKSQTGS